MSSGGAGAKVLVEQREHVLVVTLNRPEVRNALDADASLLLGEAVERAEHDAAVRVLVLTGAGQQSFCAGMDLKAVARGEAPMPSGKEHWSFGGFANHFTSKPTIAAVNGTALGGGTELALACDLVVASEQAQFGLPEVKRGLFAAAGGVFRLAEHVPRKIAMRMVLTGEPISAAEALRWGLINEVTPADRVLGAALQLAERVSANAPLAVQASKRLALGAHGGGLRSEREAWEQNAEEMARVFASRDAQEGPRAFAEKRPPVWTAS